MHVPVWHELTTPYRDAGTLAVVGLAQEQHADRTRLFARWQGFEWPILWDPFNLSGSKIVPRMILVDEHGVVRSTRARPDELDAFVATTYDAPDVMSPVADPDDAHVLPYTDRPADAPEGWRERARAAISDLLWGRGDVDAAVDALESDLMEAMMVPGVEDDGVADYAARVLSPAIFRHGVARRMRYDSPDARSDDFERAISNWFLALELDPNQYIWRRRIQQYGPRLDKPYAFYPWVDEAQAALRERGETVEPLVAALTGTERLAQVEIAPRADIEIEPDPQGRIDRDDRLIVIDTAVAGLSANPDAVRVHVRLRPNAEARAHWNNEVDALYVWLDIPDDLVTDGRLHDTPMPQAAISQEPRSIDLELRRPDGVAWPEAIPGYALYYVCEDVDGTCLYRRQDFTIEFGVMR